MFLEKNTAILEVLPSYDKYSPKISCRDAAPRISIPAHVMLGIGILLTVVFLIYRSDSSSYQSFKQDSPSGEPGWHEQVFRMKKNEEGKISRATVSHLYPRADKNSVLGNLENVKAVGPYNRAGRTRAFLIDKADPNHFLAGGVSGGMWTSADKGQSWKPINDQAPSLAVSCITQDVLNPSVIYYGTGESSGNSATIPGDGVFKSADGGKTFSRLPSTLSPAFDYVRSIASSKKISDVLFVGTADSGLYKSSDAGTSFTRVFSYSTRNIEDIETFPDGSVIIAVNGYGIFKSPTGDAGTFTKINTTFPAAAYSNIAVAYCDSQPQVLYASFENSTQDDILGMWKSVDGGANWTQVTTPAPGTYYFPWYAFVLAVKPDDPDFVVSGSVWMDYSTDGGVTWKDASFSGADDHTVVFDPVDPKTFYVGNDAGIFRYQATTIASTYSKLNYGYTVTQFYAGAYFPTGVNFFGGTQDLSTQACRNQDSVFQMIDPYNGDGTFTQINQQNPNIAYLTWQYGRIRRTDDALSTYPSHVGVKKEMDADQNGGIDDGTWFNSPFELNMLDGDQIYFTTYKRIWRTVDGAGMWTPLTNILNGSGDSPYAIGVSRKMNPTVYIGGERLLFYRVDNAASASVGTEVNLRSSAPSAIQTAFVGCVTVHPADESVVYVALSSTTSSQQPRLWKVTNGKSATPVWTSIHGDMPAGLPLNWVEADPQNPDSFLIAATDYGLYTTVNGGKNWTYESTVPNVSIHQVRLRHSDRRLFVFTHGRGVWIADLRSLATGTSGNAMKKENNFTIYPNPAANFFKLQNFQSEIYVTIKIMDVQGREVASFPDAKPSDTFDILLLKKGIYFVVIQSNRKTTVTKLLKS